MQILLEGSVVERRGHFSDKGNSLIIHKHIFTSKVFSLKPTEHKVMACKNVRVSAYGSLQALLSKQILELELFAQWQDKAGE